MSFSSYNSKKTWIDKLEKKIGKYAIDNLMLYLIGLYIVGILMNLINPAIFELYFSLDIYKVFQGQVWRLFTFLFNPAFMPTGSYNIIWTALELYIYYMLANTIERTIGAFRLNLYYFIGIILCIISSVFFNLLFGAYQPLGLLYVNRGLIFLFAILYPDVEFLLFFIIPIKAKWLAYFDAALMAFDVFKFSYNGAKYLTTFAGIYVSLYFFSYAITILLSQIPFIIIYLDLKKKSRPSKAQRKKAASFKKKINDNSTKSLVHKCCICGATPEDNPDLQFRFCSKCSGNKEYCSNHLFTHTHN